MTTPTQPKRFGRFTSCLIWGGGFLLIFLCGTTYLGQTMMQAKPSAGRVLIPTPGPTATPIEIEYSELARYTERYVGRNVLMGGEAIQVVEHGGGDYTLLVNVTYDGYWRDTIMLDCQCPVRPLEGDKVGFSAIVEGRQTYETLLGASVTVPRLTAQSFSVSD